MGSMVVINPDNGWIYYLQIDTDNLITDDQFSELCEPYKMDSDIGTMNAEIYDNLWTESKELKRILDHMHWWKSLIAPILIGTIMFIYAIFTGFWLCAVIFEGTAA